MEMERQKKNKYKLLIFDFDGTLVDSINPIAKGIIQAAECIGAPPCTLEEAKGMIGLSLDQIFRKTAPGFPPEMSKDYYNFYTKYFFEIDPSIGYFPGTQEMLDKLKSQGYRLAIATGKHRRGLDRFVKRLNIDKTFDDTICVDESASKPDPLMIQMLMDRAGVTKEETLLIGDSEHDGQTANNAGVDFVGVTFGARTREELKAFKPVFIADSFDEILDFLKPLEPLKPEEQKSQEALEA